jgi:hypothetical protein
MKILTVRQDKIIERWPPIRGSSQNNGISNEKNPE